VQEFLRRVAAATGAKREDRRVDASAVLRTVAEAICGGELGDVHTQLPSECEHGSVEYGHERGLATVFGPVNVARIAYRSRGRSNLHPADAALNLPAGAVVSRRLPVSVGLPNSTAYPRRRRGPHPAAARANLTGRPARHGRAPQAHRPAGAVPDWAAGWRAALLGQSGVAVASRSAASASR
jgi:hypothetical protein